MDVVERSILPSNHMTVNNQTCVCTYLLTRLLACLLTWLLRCWRTYVCTCTNAYVHRHIRSCADRQTSRQTDRQTELQTCTLTYMGMQVGWLRFSGVGSGLALHILHPEKTTRHHLHDAQLIPPCLRLPHLEVGELRARLQVEGSTWNWGK